MKENKKEALFRYIAAVCFGLNAILEFFAVFYYYNGGFYHFFDSLLYYLGNDKGIHIILSLVSLSLSVLLFMKKKNIGYLITLGVGILANVVYFIIAYNRDFGSVDVDLIAFDFTPFIIQLLVLFVSFIIQILAYTMFFIMLLINIMPTIMPTKYNFKSKTLILYFLSVGLYLFGILFKFFVDDSLYNYYYNYYGILFLAGIIFIGLWLWEGVKKSDPSLANSAVVQQAQSCLYGGAEKLRIYKDLLDSGAITQEEFDEKKAQILK